MDTKRKVGCSMTVPRPIRLWSKGQNKLKYRLVYTIYPNLDRFRKACEKCKYRCENRKNLHSFCRIKDEYFKLKYYGIAAAGNGSVKVGTVPPALKLKFPELYREVEAYLSRRARSFRKRVFSPVRAVEGRRGRTKPDLADGRDIYFAAPKKADSFEGVEKPLDV